MAPSDVYRWGIDMKVLPVDPTGEVWVPLLQPRRRGRYRFLTKDDAQAFITDLVRTVPQGCFKATALPMAITSGRRPVAALRRRW